MERAVSPMAELGLEVVDHELRTPLAVVVAAVEVARATQDVSPALAELLVVIHRNAMAATGILDLLARARHLHDDDAFGLRPEALDLDRLVTETVADLAHVTLRDHPTEVRLDGDANVLADVAAVREILVNLLSNAAKHGPADGAIEVVVHRFDGVVEVSVRDEGEGTELEDEDLFRLGVHSDRAPGLGLGLFLSRELARAHGGDLRLAPSATGASFVLRLTSAAHAGG